MPNEREDPIAQTIDAIATIHMRNEREVSDYQRAVERGTAEIGRPRTLFIAVGVTAAWVLVNSLAPLLHYRQIDAPPFFWLATVAGVGALFVTLIVLVTQNRQDRIDERRAQLNLQVNLLNEQKLTKIIELIVELRQELTGKSEPIDRETDALTNTLDPHAMLEALEVRILAEEILAEEDMAAEKDEKGSY